MSAAQQHASTTKVLTTGQFTRAMSLFLSVSFARADTLGSG